MADDDDDDSFGEFTFASSNHMAVNSSSQILVTAGDDEWGDFNFIQNDTTDHNLKSPQPQPQPKWAKIKGVLPLSLFGEEEEDKDEKPAIPSAGDDVKQSSFPANSGFVSNTNKYDRNAHLGINDLIANLYGQTQHQQTIKATDNGNDGNGFDFTAINSTVSKDPLSKSNSLSSFDLNTAANAAGNHGSDDKGGWEFRDAYSDSKVAHTVNDNKERSWEIASPLGLQDGSHGPIDLFATPNNGIFVESHVMDSEFDSKPITAVQNGFTLDLKAHSSGTLNELNSNPLDASVDADDTFGEYKTAFTEQPSKKKGHETSSKNCKDPVPLSIFGIEEELQEDSCLNLEHELFKSSTHGKNMPSQSSNLSINDILSDLYSQAEPISCAYTEHNPDGKVDHHHHHFNDAFSQSRVENQNLSFNKKLNDCMDFYSNLKDELCFVARRHLQSTKKAHSIATLAGEETDKEIQEALEELHQEDVISIEGQSDDNSERVICFEQYIETLHEPDFQLLESEYNISRRLSSAESDLRTAIDLINHTTTMLKILTLVPKDEPANYVSGWFKMLSVCSQELKHGTWIRKQSLEKNVHSEILSEPQGKQFIIALGEIYRAVLICGAAVKFYKPWILLSSADLKEIYALLEECHSLWSTSGLEEVIPVKSLLESMRHIQSLDALELANELLSQEESQCRLSLLSPGVVPEMKMVVWNGDSYFVTLANLWANLISPNPPNLSSFHVG